MRAYVPPYAPHIPRYIHRCKFPHIYLHSRIYEHDLLKIVQIIIEIGKLEKLFELQLVVRSYKIENDKKTKTDCVPYYT